MASVNTIYIDLQYIMFLYTLRDLYSVILSMDVLAGIDSELIQRNIKPDKDRAIAFLKVLGHSKGLIIEALKHSDWSYMEHRHYMQKSKTYNAAVELLREQFIDIAEMTIITNAMNGDQRAAEYIANSKGKARGWNNPIDGSGNKIVNLNIFVDRKESDGNDMFLDGDVVEI